MTVVRIPCPKSIRRFLAETTEWLKGHAHDAPREQQRVLTQKLLGLYQYFGLWHTTAKLTKVRNDVQRLWHKTLTRRSQRHHLTWEEWQRKPWTDLPQPKVVHRMV